MPFLDKAVPVIIVAVLLFYDVFCTEVTYRSRPAFTNYTQNWPQIKNNQNNWWSQATTPWPVLGQRPYFGNNNPTRWVTNNTNGLFSHVNTNAGNRDGGNEQKIVSNPVITTQDVSEVTDEDLRQFSESLLDKDVNNAARYVTINVQGKTTSRSNKDEAPLPLLSVDNDAFSISTISKLKKLYDNYVPETNIEEHNTPQEKREETDFLDAILDTKVMEYTRHFLMQKGAIGRDLQDFKNVLYQIWFKMYARGGRRVGSSGFEHVFLAEIKKHDVSGLHNWIFFNEEEKKDQTNYLGYMRKIDFDNKGAILKYHFTFHGIDKPVGSMFIGTSPEFEMALYTTCFLIRADKVCPMRLDRKRFVIRTYTYTYKGDKLIGSAFPEI